MPLWRGDHVAIKQLAEDFARYIYLPRLMEPSVLLQAVRDGVGLLTWQQDAFAYADSWDEAASRYRGLRGGQQGSVILDAHSVLVKPDVAAKQIEADERRAKEVGAVEVKEIEAKPGETVEITQPVEKEPGRPRRFHGSISVDPTRLARDAGVIARMSHTDRPRQLSWH